MIEHALRDAAAAMGLVEIHAAKLGIARAVAFDAERADDPAFAFDDPKGVAPGLGKDFGKLPELAVLSAMAHPELEIATTAFDAIAELPEDQNRLYSDLILSKLPGEIRPILEARMKGYEYQSDFARKYYYQGHNEGLEKGRNEGIETGRSLGREDARREGLRMVVRGFLRIKRARVSADELVAIDTIDDPVVLTELIDTLEHVTEPFDARAAFDIAVSEFRNR